MQSEASCSACRVDLQEYKTRGQNMCTKCYKVFCSSCYVLKQKLENSSVKRTRTCTSCQQLINIKQGSTTKARSTRTTREKENVPIRGNDTTQAERNHVVSRPEPAPKERSLQLQLEDQGRHEHPTLPLNNNQQLLNGVNDAIKVLELPTVVDNPDSSRTVFPVATVDKSKIILADNSHQNTKADKQQQSQTIPTPSNKQEHGLITTSKLEHEETTPGHQGPYPPSAIVQLPPASPELPPASPSGVKPNQRPQDLQICDQTPSSAQTESGPPSLEHSPTLPFPASQAIGGQQTSNHHLTDQPSNGQPSPIKGQPSPDKGQPSPDKGQPSPDKADYHKPPTPPLLFDPHDDYGGSVSEDEAMYGPDENYYRRVTPTGNRRRYRHPEIPSVYDDYQSGSSGLYPSLSDSRTAETSNDNRTRSARNLDLQEDDDLNAFENIPAYDDIPYTLLLVGAFDKEILVKAKKKQHQMNLMKSFQERNEPIGEQETRKHSSYEVQLQVTRGTPEATSEDCSLQVATQSLKLSVKIRETNSSDTNVDKTKSEVSNASQNYSLQNDTDSVPNVSDEKADVTNIGLPVTKPTEAEHAEATTEIREQNHTDRKKIDDKCSEDIKTSRQFQPSQETLSATMPTNVSKEDTKSEPTPAKRSESDHDRLIREKRLERFNKNVVIVESGNTSTSLKKDNRAIAPNADPAKMVKSKVFKNPIQSSPVNPIESPPVVDDEHTQRPTAMAFFQQRRQAVAASHSYIPPSTQMYNSNWPLNAGASETIRGNTDPIKPPRTQKKNSTSTNTKTSEKQRSNQMTPDSKPHGQTAIPVSSASKEKQTKNTGGGKKTKQDEVKNEQEPIKDVQVSKVQSESDDDDIPSVMKVLQRKEKENQRREKDGDFLKQFMTTLMGMPQPDEPVQRQKSKERKRSMNKNSRQSFSEATDSTDREYDDYNMDRAGRTLLILMPDKQQSGNHDNIGDQDGAQKMPMFLMENPQFPRQQHEAFRRLRYAQTEYGIRCTACGHPGCQGQNVQKMKELVVNAKNQGFEVRDVTPDGNCMFAAVVDQLQLYGNSSFSSKSLREAAVSWLIDNPLSEDGTHCEQFMAENWNTYLQRMMAEGEWGDHVVLRAVANITSNTIRVLNVNGEDHYWTVLDPMKETDPGNVSVVTLGHVGEYHYTSLRPADTSGRAFLPSVETEAATTLDDQSSMPPIEGSENIEIFKDDYIDPWSEMPVVHFSFLLKLIIPVDVMNNAAIFSSQIIDQLQQRTEMMNRKSGYPLTTITTGSVAEGTFYTYLFSTKDDEGIFKQWLNMEIMGIFNMAAAIPLTEAGQSSDDYLLDDTGCHVGYTKVMSRYFLDSNTPLTRCVENTAMQSLSASMMTNLSIPTNDGSTNPTINTQTALKCPIWPAIANAWKTRERFEGWPSDVTIATIVNDGCVILAKSHTNSMSPNTEWQYSFAQAETILFHDAVSSHQKYCYVLLWCLCFQALKYQAAFDVRVLKNVFFYTCESVPAEYWQTSPGSCVLYMLDELCRGYSGGVLSNYFVKANNMIDHLSSVQMKDIEDQLSTLRAQPNLYLRQINEHLNYVPNGNKVIDDIWEDASKFKWHGSVKESTLQVFVPCLIERAKGYVHTGLYDTGLQTLNQAFQDRLAVSTCDDSVTYQLFLQGSVSGLSTSATIWFSNYIDNQLAGQLSKTMIRETCGDMSLVQINTILPGHVVGTYGGAEVPQYFSNELDLFCHDYAAFLVFAGKVSDVLPVLFYCHEQYKARTSYFQDQNGVQPRFTDDALFYVYSGIYKIYRNQSQMHLFRALLQDMFTVGCRLHNRGVYMCLANIAREMRDLDGSQRFEALYKSVPEGQMDSTYYSRCYHWPTTYLLC